MRQFVDRYGVALGVILGLVIVISVLPGNATDARLGAANGDGSSLDERASAPGGADGLSDGTLTDGAGTAGGAPGESVSGTGDTTGGSTTGGSAEGAGPVAPGGASFTFGAGPDC